MVATRGDNELITICVQRSRKESLRVVGRGTCLRSPPWTVAQGPQREFQERIQVCAELPGKRGKDVDKQRVCFPSRCKGVNAIWGEGASDLSVADFTGIAVELDFIPGAVGSHYRLLAGGDHNPNICFFFFLKSMAAVCKVRKRR